MPIPFNEITELVDIKSPLPLDPLKLLFNKFPVRKLGFRPDIVLPSPKPPEYNNLYGSPFSNEILREAIEDPAPDPPKNLVSEIEPFRSRKTDFKLLSPLPEPPEKYNTCELPEKTNMTYNDIRNKNFMI